MATKLVPPTKPTKASLFYYEVVDIVANLYGRWLDEKEFEDLEDYKKPLQKFAKKHGIKIVGVSKRPWGFKFTEGEKEYFLGATSRQVFYKRTK
jgi:hypothetical protein